MRLLFLAPRYPHPATRGDQRRVLELLRELAPRTDELTLLCFGDGPHLPIEGVRVRTVRRTVSGTLAANLRHPDPRLPLQVRLYADAALRSALEEELLRGPDVVHVTLSRLGTYVPPPGPWHRHLDLVDSLALNMRTRASASRGPSRVVFATEAKALDRYERAAVQRVESASVVAEADRAAIPGLPAEGVVPNGVDTSRFAYTDPGEREPVLIYFGNLGYFHAIEPARRIAHDVLPLVRSRVPGARLRIVGARPAAAVVRLASLPGVDVVGPVPDIAEELHGAAVAVLPAYTGSGIKNKVLEAFAAGTPVVANRLGVEGVVGAGAGSHHLGAESPQELADACVTLLAEPELRVSLAREARRLVEREYTWARQAERLLALYGRRA